MRLSVFEKTNPYLALTFFLSAVLITMLSLNPVFIGISLLGSIFVCIACIGIKAFLKSLPFTVLFVSVIAFLNPLFSSYGFWQAVIYGLFTGLMLAAVINWCRCLTVMLTGEKTLYVFSRVLPKTGFVLSLSIKFFPLLVREMRKKNEVMEALGYYNVKGLAKLKNRLNVFSAVIAGSLESAVETSNSIKARGFGKNNRTRFLNYKTDWKTIILLLVNVSVFGYLCLVMFSGYSQFAYYPEFVLPQNNLINITAYGLLALLVISPLAAEALRSVKWKLLKRKI